MVEISCKNCGIKFRTKSTHIYCSLCRKYHKKCEICGKEIFVQARTCSKECAYKLRKQSWLKTCGAEHNFSKNSKSRKQWETKLLEKEGINNVWQRNEVKEKCKNSIQNNYGVDNISKSDLIKKIKKQTFLQNFPDIRKRNEENGIWIPLSCLSKYEIYKYHVWQFTKINFIKYGDEYLNLNKKTQKQLNKILEQKNKLTIDHKFSIKQGFLDNIPPEVIGSIVNLEILTMSKNASKKEKCSITLQKLTNDYHNFINENKINQKNSDV